MVCYDDVKLGFASLCCGRLYEEYLLISYNSQLLQDICFQTPTAVRYFGEEITRDLQARHADILAARNVYELPIGQVVVNENECSISFSNSLSIDMIPNYGSAIRTGQFDWATVGRIKFMRINNVE